MSSKVRIFLIEDDRNFVSLIQKLTQKDARLDYMGHAAGIAPGVEMARKIKPDVVVIDLSLAGNELYGIEAAKKIRLTTASKVLLLTSYDQPEVIINACKRAFASGYLLKNQHRTLADTIYETAMFKTPQELFIKELLLSELSPAERGVLDYLIAGNLYGLSSSSSKTIANQKTSIFRKLGLKNTNELIGVFR